MDQGKKVEFDPPKGFVLPEGVQAGEEFDLVCTFRTKQDGKICLTQLGDTKMPGYDDKKESRPSYSGYTKELQAGMAQGNSEVPANPGNY